MADKKDKPEVPEVEEKVEEVQEVPENASLALCNLVQGGMPIAKAKKKLGIK